MKGIRRAVGGEPGFQAALELDDLLAGGGLFFAVLGEEAALRHGELADGGEEDGEIASVF